MRPYANVHVLTLEQLCPYDDVCPSRRQSMSIRTRAMVEPMMAAMMMETRKTVSVCVLM